MPFYHQMGKIPAKRHVVYRQENGSLYHEELVGTQGFSGLSSLVYHLHPPTRVIRTGEPYSIKPKVAIENNMKSLSFQGFEIPVETDYLEKQKGVDGKFGSADWSGRSKRQDGLFF